MARDKGYRSDNSDEEGEALILHQFEVDSRGRPFISTIPSSHDQESEIKEDQDDSEAGDLESGFFERPSRSSNKTGSIVSASNLPSDDPSRDKSGRPDWLISTIQKTSKFKHIRLFICFGLLILAGLGIYLGLGPEGKDGTNSGKGHTFNVDGDIWNDEDGLLPYQFPTKIGYPGVFSTGSPPNLAEEESLKATPTRGSAPYETRLPQMKGFNPFEHMGPLSPYFSSPGFGIDDSQQIPLPSSCSLSQVHILHRHGSRYPTTGSPAELVKQFISSKSSYSFSGPLSFLNTYSYRLGSELLTPIGRSQLYSSGVHSSMLYEKLIRKDIAEHGRLFVRTGSQQRIVDSAISWLQGFFGMEYWQNQTKLEVQIEENRFNTTLAPNFACPNSGKEGYEPGGKISTEWVNQYLKEAVVRLQPYSQGKELTPDILFGMQQVCSYDTVAFGHSSFCGLFLPEEWLGYEYAWDLKFHGSYGNSSPVGAAMGVGWVNEFISRLTQTKWNPQTQTSENSTFNSNDRTFPVNRGFYVDFTHDSSIASVLAALHLPDFEKSLDPKSVDLERKYKTSHIVPFAARMTAEVLSCPSSLSRSSLSPSARDETKYLRLILNDAILPLAQLSLCEARPDGLCSLDRFLESQKDRMKNAHWDRCNV